MRLLLPFFLFALNLCMFAAGPRVLIINAHPDDESGCAATVYKITHDLQGTVDLCLLTNGEGGFKYSTLAEDWYGLELTDEKVGRQHLPRIRKQEMMNAGKVIGIRNIFFLEHWDQRFTTDVNEVFTQAWDTSAISRQLAKILSNGAYDFVFCLLPTPETHGAHKGASILALEQVVAMGSKRPIILGVGFARKDSLMKLPKTLEAFPITSIKTDTEPFVFDLSTRFGFKKALSYKIILAWLVAEHKSQGTVQLGMTERDLEAFYYFNCNPPEGIEKTRQLFEDLKVLHFKEKTY